VRASHDALVEVFERIESFFMRLGVYTQVSLTTEMAEVFVKIVAEVLSILSIATKEVKRKRASELLTKYTPNLTIVLFDQKYISGNCWDGKILRMRSRD
jgi:hypothetical protein